MCPISPPSLVQIAAASAEPSQILKHLKKYDLSVKTKICIFKVYVKDFYLKYNAFEHNKLHVCSLTCNKRLMIAYHAITRAIPLIDAPLFLFVSLKFCEDAFPFFAMNLKLNIISYLIPAFIVLESISDAYDGTLADFYSLKGEEAYLPHLENLKQNSSYYKRLSQVYEESGRFSAADGVAFIWPHQDPEAGFAQVNWILKLSERNDAINKADDRIRKLFSDQPALQKLYLDV